MVKDDCGQGLRDPGRLTALAASGLLDGPAPEQFQRIARLAARITRAPVALAGVLDADRHVVVASGGRQVGPFAPGHTVPAERSFCARVVRAGTALLVDDAEADDQYAPIIDGTGVVAYIGVPFRDPAGHTLGALSAVDTRPRAWTAEDAAALKDLADLVGDELRLRQTAIENERLVQALVDESRTDHLTGLYNRRHWREQVPIELARARRDDRPVSMIMLDLDDFKQVNDRRGHIAGDAILAAVGQAWRPLVRVPDVIARWGGDEFAVLLPNSTQPEAEAVAARLVDAARPHVGATAGVAAWDRAESADGLLARADAALLTAKANRPPSR